MWILSNAIERVDGGVPLLCLSDISICHLCFSSIHVGRRTQRGLECVSKCFLAEREPDVVEC